MDDSGVGNLLSRNDIRLIAELAAGLSVEVFLVGGCLRDLLLGRESNDLDFALSGAYEELPRAFADRISGSFFWLDEGRRHSRVVKKVGEATGIYDFAPMGGNSMEEDLSNRDFTINALGVSLHDGNSCHIDPLRGRDDLRSGLVRMCSVSSFDDDPLRLMRAVRFAAELGFAIEDDTWKVLCRNSSLLSVVAAERVRDELFRTLVAPGCATSLKRLCDSGLWGVISPGAASAVAEAGIARAAETERLCRKMVEPMAASLEEEVECGVTAASLVKLAAFLGRGESAAHLLAERLRLGREATKMLKVLCRDDNALLRSLGSAATRRQLFRFFRDREPAGPGVLILARSDGAISEPFFSQLIGYFLREYNSEDGELFLSGGEVMEVLNIPPGKAVGEAMDRLREAEASGLVNDRDEARSFVKNLLTKEETIG